MAFFPVFLSVVFVVRNQGEDIEAILADAAGRIGALVSDYELIVVDNASSDGSVSILKTLTGANGLANIQVYALATRVDSDTAAWVGMDNALGDYVACIDPMLDDIAVLPQMLERAAAGADTVFAHNLQQAPQSMAYRIASAMFNRLYQYSNGVHLEREAPAYRLLNRKIVNFLAQHRQPSLSYRHLPASGGFAKAIIDYSATPRIVRTKDLAASIDRGARMLVSTTRAPMRLVTSLSLFGALANLGYAGYVVIIAMFKPDVAPGWVSLALQQSGMFFLFSLVLMVLGEYLLQMASLSNEGPQYYIGQEFCSEQITRRGRLNIETAHQRPAPVPGDRA